jgi:hypothetical protein
MAPDFGPQNNLIETKRVPVGDSKSIHNARGEMESKKHPGESAIDSSSKRGEMSVKEATASYEKWSADAPP